MPDIELDPNDYRPRRGKEPILSRGWLLRISLVALVIVAVVLARQFLYSLPDAIFYAIAASGIVVSLLFVAWLDGRQ